MSKRTFVPKNLPWDISLDTPDWAILPFQRIGVNSFCQLDTFLHLAPQRAKILFFFWEQMTPFQIHPVDLEEKDIFGQFSMDFELIFGHFLILCLRGKVGQQFWAGAAGRKLVLGRPLAAAVGRFCSKMSSKEIFDIFANFQVILTLFWHLRELLKSK